MSIKISVIIPTWQRPELLIKCLKKLSEQSFPKRCYEVIVITDGPDIETQSVVSLLSEQELLFNVFCYSTNEKKGPAAARNKGVTYAKGRLLVFTDDDCLPHQDWLIAYWNFHGALDKAESAFTGQTVVPRSTPPTDYEKNIANLETAEFITANCALTKAAFEKVNGFDESFPIAWREDSDMHFRLIKKNIAIYTVKNAVVVHPVRQAKWGVSLKEQKKSLFNALLYKKHVGLYKQKIRAQPVWNYYMMIALFCVFIGAFISASTVIALIAFSGWFIFFVEFTVRRLRPTSKKRMHVLEIITTSFFIPFLSVFWTLYGAIKYKTFFL